MTHSPLTNGIQLTSDSDSRNGRAVDRFIVHHATTTSLAAILSLFQPGGREVSANYALGSDGTLVLAVDEDWSAWTSASWYDDRAITIEVANSVAGGSWPVSDAAFDKLARLIADWSLRYGQPITDDTVLTHQELYQRFGESYATACPGDLERRKGELLALANRYRSGAASGDATIVIPPPQEDEAMFIVHVSADGRDAAFPKDSDWMVPDTGVMRRLSQLEVRAYDWFQDNSSGPKLKYRRAVWSGDDARTFAVSNGYQEYTMLNDTTPVPTGKVIYPPALPRRV